MPQDWPNSYVCMMAGRSDLSKFTEWSWQGSFTVNNERAVRTLKPSSEEQKCFERIPSRPEFACKLDHSFNNVNYTYMSVFASNLLVSHGFVSTNMSPKHQTLQTTKMKFGKLLG